MDLRLVLRRRSRVRTKLRMQTRHHLLLAWMIIASPFQRGPGACRSGTVRTTTDRGPWAWWNWPEPLPQTEPGLSARFCLSFSPAKNVGYSALTTWLSTRFDPWLRREHKSTST